MHREFFRKIPAITFAFLGFEGGSELFDPQPLPVERLCLCSSFLPDSQKKSAASCNLAAFRFCEIMLFVAMVSGDGMKQ